MAVPSPEEILTIASESVAEFIQDQASSKTLSSIVKRLNHDLLEGDATRSELAARALNHLGFSGEVYP